MTALDDGACPKSPDGLHSNEWWDCEPCTFCGHDSGGEADCDCERHTAMREPPDTSRSSASTAASGVGEAFSGSHTGRFSCARQKS